MLEVTPVAALRDNYIWLIHAPRDRRRVLVVDPGDATPVEKTLAREGLQPAGILVTHHHPDHIGGAAALAAASNIPVHGPSTEAHAVVTHPLNDGERLELPELGLAFDALHIPGHTLGHTAFFGHDALFCGDTLFSAGCGRLFEGTPEQMLSSLQRLAGLPPQTQLYCGHEYTAANLAFAATVEPQNRAIAAYRKKVDALRQDGRPTLPSALERELDVNPFLRTKAAAVQHAVGERFGTAPGDEVGIFAALRRWKDDF